MKFTVVIEPFAESDIRAAFEWYESQVRDLGHEFLVSIRRCFGRLERTPEMYSQVMGSVRRARVDRFPFAVYYYHDKETIYVLGVFHYKRNPASWMKRVRIWGRT